MGYWAEIRSDYFCTDFFPEDGDVVTSVSIDAWKENEEQGAVIAQVLLSKHGDVLVDYRDPVARVDEEVQFAIKEAKDRLRAYYLERAVAPDNESVSEKRSVYCLCETHELGDAIREFEILAVSADKAALLRLMQAKIAADEYGFTKENGVYFQTEDSYSTNFNDGFVEYSISEMPVLSREELERKSLGLGFESRLDFSGNESVVGEAVPVPPDLSDQIQAAESVKNDVIRDGCKPTIGKDR